MTQLYAANTNYRELSSILLIEFNLMLSGQGRKIISGRWDQQTWWGEWVGGCCIGKQENYVIDADKDVLTDTDAVSFSG